MKTCPVCHAVAFDDAETCFGCLHRFGDEPEGIQGDTVPEGMLPEFRIKFTPTLERSGSYTWKCAIEV